LLHDRIDTYVYMCTFRLRNANTVTCASEKYEQSCGIEDSALHEMMMCSSFMLEKARSTLRWLHHKYCHRQVCRTTKQKEVFAAEFAFDSELLSNPAGLADESLCHVGRTCATGRTGHVLCCLKSETDTTSFQLHIRDVSNLPNEIHTIGNQIRSDGIRSSEIRQQSSSWPHSKLYIYMLNVNMNIRQLRTRHTTTDSTPSIYRSRLLTKQVPN